MTHLETREQASGGACTWALQLSSGEWVYDPTVRHATGYDRESAYLWLSQDRALKVAMDTPWIGASASAKRARP